MNQSRDAQPLPLLETDVAYQPRSKPSLPAWKRRRKIRRHINARLFAFTVVSLFVGLGVGYYLGNNRSLEGFLVRFKHTVATPPADLQTPRETAVTEPDIASVDNSNANQDALNANASVDALNNQPSVNPNFNSPNLEPANASNFNASKTGNPFEEYNRRAASGVTTVAPSSVTLAASGLVIPVAGIRKDQLVDTFKDARSENRVHDAIDIIAARGTPVLAATDGKLMRFYESEKGGLTIYQMSADGKLVFYYAHLDGYAEGLQIGQDLKRGQVIGYVGDTGNATPGNCHLHFAIWTVTDPKRYWEGDNINPYPLLVK